MVTACVHPEHSIAKVIFQHQRDFPGWIQQNEEVFTRKDHMQSALAPATTEYYSLTYTHAQLLYELSNEWVNQCFHESVRTRHGYLPRFSDKVPSWETIYVSPNGHENLYGIHRNGKQMRVKSRFCSHRLQVTRLGLCSESFAEICRHASVFRRFCLT